MTLNPATERRIAAGIAHYIPPPALFGVLRRFAQAAMTGRYDPWTLIVPGRFGCPVGSLTAASAFYNIQRDKSDEGGSTWPEGLIFDGEEIVAYISYNGRVWRSSPSGPDWGPGTVPLFESVYEDRDL